MTGLHVRGKDMPGYRAADQPMGELAFRKKVYGVNASIMVASRENTYHSPPHLHECEQLNYQVSGELYLFIENKPFLMKPGDFSRVPPNTHHWAWEKNPKEPSVLFEFHAPPLFVLKSACVPIFDEGEPIRTNGETDNMYPDPETYHLNKLQKEAESKMQKGLPNKSPLLKSAHQVKQVTLPSNTTVSGVPLSCKIVYGTTGSMTVSTAPPEYHSKPQYHNCEQFSYVHSGEIWMFIGKRAYHLEQGDFLRVPPNAIHWAWNKGRESCVLLGSHFPGLQDDPLMKHAEPLFDKGEPVKTTGSPRTIILDPSYYHELIEEAEKQIG